MKIRRTISILIAAAVLFTFMSAAYYDTEGNIARDAINRWSERGILLGYDGYFRPDDNITRAEMAVIINRIFEYGEAQGGISFDDVTDGWYKDALLKVSANGIILGYGGKARPFDNITRAEAVVMLCRAFRLTANESGIIVFNDSTDIPEWAAGYVGAMAAAEFLPFKGSFIPSRDITRAETVLILDKIISAFYNESGTYSDNIYGNALINTPSADLSGITIAGNLYITGKTETVYLTDASIIGEVYNIGGAQIINDGYKTPALSGNIAELDLSHGSDSTVNVIIRAGRSLAQIFELIEEKGVCDADKLFAACESIDFSRYYSFLSSAYAAVNRVFTFEGYLAPGTYTLYLDSSPALVIKTILDSLSVTYEDYARRAESTGYTLDQIITLASIIEKEAGGSTVHDHATVSSVIYNRLKSNSKLQMNVTENYLEQYVIPYAPVDLEQYSKHYDTYKCAGLPASPICSPRAECIKSAFEPYNTEYFFFRSDSYGNIYYAVTYDEHLQNGTVAANASAYLGYLGNVNVNVAEEDVYIPTDGRYSGWTIMIDAGHGGTDPGAYTGSVSEKDINLAVALLVRDKLREQGVNVIMTRSGDTTIKAQERADLANEMRADLFLSIHCNSVEDSPGVNGIETYYYPGDEASRIWSQCVQNAFIPATGAKDRGVKPYELIVLHYTEMPSVLAELGFLTNSFELDLLLSEIYQNIIAQALADGTFAYIDSISR